MAVAHIPMSDTFVAITSTVSGLFAFGLSAALGLKPIISLGIGIGIGGLLFYSGIVPIGALVVLGIAAAGVFFKRE